MAVPVPGRRSLPGPAPADGFDGVDITGTGYGRCGMLSSACAQPRTSGSRRSPSWCSAGRPARSPRSRRRRPARTSLRSAPCTACCTPRFGAGRRPRHGGGVPPGGGARAGSTFVAGAAHGVQAGSGVAVRAEATGGTSRRSRWRGIRTWRAARSPSRVAPGRGGRGVAGHTAAHRAHEGADRASRRGRGDGWSGRSCSRCSPTISCPGRGDGWLAAARSRPRPGSPSA